MPKNPAGKYGAELDTLRDQLIEAVQLRRLAALEAGLAVFEQLAEEILHRVQVIDETMGDRRKEFSWRQTVGPSRPADRLAPLSHALWPVIEQAVLSGDPQLLRQTLSTVNGLARTAESRRDLASFTDVVVLYSRVAQRLRTAAPAPSAPAIGVPGLTVQLLRVGEAISMRTGTNREEGDSFSYLAAALKQAWEMARLLIDESNPSELQRWADSYEQALALPLHGYEGASTDLHVLNQLGATALRGWVLLSWQEDWKGLENETAVALYAALAGMGSPAYFWEAAVRDADEQLADALGFSWWESLSRSALRAYVMQFGTYRDAAAALILVGQTEARASVPRLEDLRGMDLPQLKQQGSVARRLQAAISRLEKYAALEIGTPADRGRLTERLSAIEDALGERESALLIRRPLDPTRVAAFRDSVLTGEERAPSLARTLHRCAPEITDVLTDVPPLFGVHSLAPKEYFVATDVHADPSSLGETMAASVVRGEDRLVLKRIAELCSTEPLADRDISDVVSRTVRDLDGHRDLHVMVVGVADWWFQLRRSMGQDMGLGFNETFQVGGVTYSHHPSGDLRGAVIADLSRLACYSRIVAADDEQQANSLAHLSVDLVSASEAREMALAKEAELSERELSMEIRRLEQQVRVRVFVRPLLKVLDPSAGRLILSSAQEIHER